MNARVLVLTLALALAGGCRKSTPPPTPGAAAIQKLVDFRDRACTCIEVKCVRLAQKELADWLLAEGGELGKIKFTPAQDAAGKKASAEMDACVSKMDQSPAP